MAVKVLTLNEFWSAGEDLKAFQSDDACPDCTGLRGHHSDPSCPTLLARCRELRVDVRRYGAQKDFVSNPERGSAYIGGLGSGKTFAGIARGLKFSQQPMPDGTFHGPRGCIAAINYPVLEDVVLPQFFEMMDGSGLWKTGKQETSWLSSKKKARLIAGCRCADRQKCKHEATILFRSLDRPNWMRGLELTWYFIDEGRHITGAAWKVLWGRLRQTGYEKAGWVCSTPNGFDWMWEKFHPDSPLVTEDAVWFGASTYENADHLPDEYIDELFKEYEGAFLRQEVFGEFIGVTEGAVFFNFAPHRCIVELPYDPNLELDSMWDFGMGDLGVVSFAQIDWRQKELPSGDKEYVPVGRLVGSIEAKDWVSEEWAKAFYKYCDVHFGGRLPSLNVGDPAGRQRSAGKKTSIIEDLAQHGIIIATPPRRAQDYAVRILTNMMEADRILVDKTKAARLGAAISSHKWKTDDNGIRIGNVAVHDWTCIAEGQRVRTAGGWVAIEDLVAETPVVWGSDDAGRLTPARATAVRQTHDDAPLVEVRTAHRSVRCTPEHQFLLRDGNYRRADVLRPGDPLVPFREHANRGYTRVLLNDGSAGDEHVMVQHKFNGPVPFGWTVDHINGNKRDNRPENLRPLSRAEHCKVTAPQRPWGSDKSHLKTVPVEFPTNDRYDDYRVIEVIEAGRGRVFDIEVPETSNFVVEGLVVHNSHYADGLRYWADIRFSVTPRRSRKPAVAPPGPGTIGWLTGRILQEDVSGWLGAGKPDPVRDWEPGTILERDGRHKASGE